MRVNGKKAAAGISRRKWMPQSRLRQTTDGMMMGSGVVGVCNFEWGLSMIPEFFSLIR